MVQSMNLGDELPGYNNLGINITLDLGLGRTDHLYLYWRVGALEEDLP